MKKQFETPHIYKPVMAGLLVGIVATILSIVYDIIFRDITSFPMHELVNVSTLIFGILLLLTIAGCLFALIDRYSNHASIIYQVISVIITLTCVYVLRFIHRSDDPVTTIEFRHLLLGIIIIIGTASLFIPYLSKNETKYI